jgi:hypothetical protein
MAVIAIGFGILACVTSAAAQAPPSPAIPADAKNYTPPKTPWGDPDLQESGRGAS